MASPRKLISKINQASPQLLQVPSQFRSLNTKHLSRATLNIDTPNRMKILNQGLSDQQLNIIGTGAFGTVYKASYKGINIAAKIVKHNIINKEMMNAEMRGAKLKHKNIVQILGYNQGEALSIIMMELCGPSLDELIEERPLSKEERISFLIDVAKALKYCHDANVIHADVKPKNVFISENNVAKLGDFGSSVTYEKKDINITFVKGTPGYEAPEVIRGKSLTPASDIYSLGICAWQMLSRLKPFAGYHSHVILYLSGKGIKPEKHGYLDDEFQGRYKHLYRTMWSTSAEDRPFMNQILEKLKELRLSIKERLCDKKHVCDL